MSTALEAVEERDDTGYVIGGQSVYATALPYSDRALVSELPEQATRCRVVPYLGTNWSVVDRHESDEFEVVEYRNDDPLS